MNRKWTKDQIRRLLTEGRRFEGQSRNNDKAHDAIVRGIKRLYSWHKRGRDGIGFAGKGMRGSQLAWLAGLNGKLWGKPLRQARALCLRHAGQLANFANTGSPS